MKLEYLSGFSKSGLIDVVMALVNQVVQLTERNAHFLGENAPVWGNK